MNYRNKFLITITGTLNSPWDANWKECIDTWGKELLAKGYNLKVVIGDELLPSEYQVEGNYLKVRCSDAKVGLVEKALISNKWFLENTNCEYHVRVDSDTYVDPNRFDEWCKEIITQYEVDYLGCVLPYSFPIDIPLRS